jgi:hypothetical protein
MNQDDIGTPIALTGVGVIVMGVVYLILKSYCNDRIETMRFSERFARRFEIQEKHMDKETVRSLRHLRAVQSLNRLKMSSPAPALSPNTSAISASGVTVVAIQPCDTSGQLVDPPV